MLTGAKITSQYVFDQLEEAKRQKDAADLAEKIAAAKRNIRQSMRDYDERNQPEDRDDDEYVLPRPLHKGDTVQHRNLGTNGVLLDDPDKNGNVNVRMGAVKAKANVSDLRLIDEATFKKTQKKQSGGVKTSVSRSFKLECDVRGMTGEEAWFVVDKYLDDAKLAHVQSATIIHGKGTGALRTMLWKHFKEDKRVASFRAGQYGEGDYGVTVVELK